MSEKAIMTTAEYGCIRLRLKERIDERGISRYALARLVDTRFEVVDRWYNNDISKLDMDILARICYVLECSVSDILEYVPAPEKEAAK